MMKRTETKTKYRSVQCSLLALMVVCGALLSSCADMQAPNPRSINIPAPTPPEQRRKAINEAPDSVVVVPLGEDVLVPAMDRGDPLPTRHVGPFELRNENLAGALQLILADYDIPLAFESEAGLDAGVTVSNLKGPLDKVVDKVCSLADLYCLYDDGVITVKESQTFTVSLPPLPAETSYDSIVTGLRAFTEAEGVVDTTTRTMIYNATERTAKKAEAYFDRLRKSTAMIVYETYIWEVGLEGGNSAGIRWSQLAETIGAFNVGFSIDQSTTLASLGNPISIGLPARGAINLATGDILNFISTQGSVKTISQPQLTVLSGSEATMRVAETQSYVESLTRTQNTTNNTETVSTTTGQVDTGFTLTIGSSWDNGTVYGNIDINIQQLLQFQTFPAGTSTINLPNTAERELQTQVRVRPGDSVLIAGLVRERQEFDKSGAGLNRPVVPFSRTGTSENTELVILLRPRVIVYKPLEEIRAEKAALALGAADVPDVGSFGMPEGVTSDYLTRDQVVPEMHDDAESEESEVVNAEDAAKSAGKDIPSTAKKAVPISERVTPVPTDLPMGSLPSNLLDPSLGGAP